MANHATVTLVLGGAHSGKSRYAESLVMGFPSPWLYVATADARDSEVAARIAVHRARRGAEWRTVEAPREMAAAIAAAPVGNAILVESLTWWLSNLMVTDADVAAEAKRLDGVLANAKVPIVLVSNEVGGGIAPDNPLARTFREAQGRLNQQVAERANRVVLMVAGLPLVLKWSGGV